MKFKWFSLFLLSAVLAGAEERWLRLQSPHFEVLTNASAGAGRDVLRRFEQIRNLFESRTSRGSLTPLPVRVFVFRGEADFEPYKVNRNAAGYYQSDHDRDYIAMQSTGAETYRVVYHEYVHLLLRHAGYRVPVWFNEGTAELFSTAEVASSEVRIGDLIPAHILTLRDERMLDIPTLTAVGHDSPYYNERGKTGIFYAQSWALVHMLNFSPDYRPGLANFIDLILNGEDGVRAFQQAYGKSPAAILQDLTAYISRERFTGVRFKSAKFDGGKVPVDPVPTVDSQLALADLLLVTGKTNEARLFYGGLDASNPGNPAVQQALGQFAFRTEDFAEARRRYEIAIAANSKDSRLYYDYAMVLRELAEAETSIVESLNHAIGLDARNFGAHQFLGYLHLRSERYAEAITHFRIAADLQPSRAVVWENLAIAYQRSGDKEHARAAAKAARKVANGPEEAARLDALIELIETDADKIVTAPPFKRDEVVEAIAAPSLIEGMLVQVDCIGSKARLHVATTTGRAFLLFGAPGSVKIEGGVAGKADLSCGPVSNLPVAVEFRPEENRTYGTSGTVVLLRFR